MNTVIVVLCALVALSAGVVALGFNLRGIGGKGLYTFLGAIIGACLFMGVFTGVLSWRAKPASVVPLKVSPLSIKLPAEYSIVTDGRNFRFRRPNGTLSLADFPTYEKAVAGADYYVNFLQEEKSHKWVTVTK